MTNEENFNQKRTASTFERVCALAGGLAMISGLVFVREINPTNSNLLPVCPLYSATGLACPGCGGTRGMHALLNGDVLTALDYNLMLVFFVPLIVYGLFALFLYGVRGRGLGIPRFAPHAIWIFLILMLLFSVLRNLPFYPFTVLAP